MLIVAHYRSPAGRHNACTLAPFPTFRMQKTDQIVDSFKDSNACLLEYNSLLSVANLPVLGGHGNREDKQ